MERVGGGTKVGRLGEKKKNGDEELKRARVLTPTMLRMVIRNVVTALPPLGLPLGLY